MGTEIPGSRPGVEFFSDKLSVAAGCLSKQNQDGDNVAD
jgi:hypothetical protein